MAKKHPKVVHPGSGKQDVIIHCCVAVPGNFTSQRVEPGLVRKLLRRLGFHADARNE